MADKDISRDAILNALDPDRMRKSEFVEHFEAATNMWLKLKEKLVEDAEKFAAAFEEAKLSLKKEHAETTVKETANRTTQFETKGKDFETRLNKAILEMQGIIQKALDEQTNGMNFIYDKVASLKDGAAGKPGKSADEDALADKVTERMATFFQEEMAKLDDKYQPKQLSVGGAYTPLVRVLYNQTFPETPNGVRTTFTLAKAPKNVGGVAIYQNRTRAVYGDDFTIADKVVTFSVAPITDDVLRYDITY